MTCMKKEHRAIERREAKAQGLNSCLDLHLAFGKSHCLFGFCCILRLAKVRAFLGFALRVIWRLGKVRAFLGFFF